MSVSILGDRVLIRKVENDKKSAGGLFVLTGDDVHTPKGIVLKVGEGKLTKTGTLIPLAVKVDDTIMYYPDRGLSIKLDGESLLVLKEDDIYAVVD